MGYLRPKPSLQKNGSGTTKLIAWGYKEFIITNNKTLGENENNKYSGILEADTIK